MLSKQSISLDSNKNLVENTLFATDFLLVL